MKLEPVDKKQCQAERPNRASFMSLGGKPGFIRCQNVPLFIAKERRKGPDGKRGSMSLCAQCLNVFVNQMPGHADISSIKVKKKFRSKPPTRAKEKRDE